MTRASVPRMTEISDQMSLTEIADVLVNCVQRAVCRDAVVALRCHNEAQAAVLRLVTYQRYGEVCDAIIDPVEPLVLLLKGAGP